MKYKKYLSYKDSGIDWLNEIPSEWNITKVKHKFLLGRGRVISLEELEEEGEYPVYSSQTKNNGILGYINSYDFDCKQITWTTDGANAGTVFLREGKHNCTNVCGTLLPIKKNENLEYLTYTLGYSTTFYKRPDTNGAKIMNGEMSEIFLTFPPVEEQQQIANFLDKTTAKIDTLIEKQTKLIEILKEKRQAVISHAVTKGINPNAKMKDSGVEWLGEIPEHWEIPKIKYIAKTDSGGTPTSSMREEYYTNGMYPWIRTTDLNNSELFTTPIKITQRAIMDTACNIIKEGSVLIGMYGGAGTIGKHSLLRFTATINQAVCSITPSHKMISEYLHYFIEFYRPFWMIGAMGTRKDPNIGQDTINNRHIINPPLEEQEQIVNYLDNKTSKMDKLIEKANKSIELLKEKRTALISAAVTGKIDVRE